MIQVRSIKNYSNRTFGTVLAILIISAAVTLAQNGNKRKEANQLADKVGQLVDLSAKRSVLRFNGNSSSLLQITKNIKIYNTPKTCYSNFYDN